MPKLGASLLNVGNRYNDATVIDKSGSIRLPGALITYNGQPPKNGEILIGNGRDGKFTLATIRGTTNRVSIANGPGTIQISIPQDIHTAASPTFAGITITGTGGGQISFFGGGPAGQQTSGANLTNNVTSGGTNDTIANFTDLTTYSVDAATIRNDIYQLARKLKQVNDGLRAYGLLS